MKYITICDFLWRARALLPMYKAVAREQGLPPYDLAAIELSTTMGIAVGIQMQLGKKVEHELYKE